MNKIEMKPVVFKEINGILDTAVGVNVYISIAI